MYTVYRYSSGAEEQDILDDIVAILTGETDVSYLSSSCDKPNTTITSTVAAGWAVHDIAPGYATGVGCVIKAPVADDATAFKYVGLRFIKSTGAFYVYIYEDWDNVAHSGTNGSNTVSEVGGNQLRVEPNIDDMTRGNFYLSASLRHIALYSYYLSGTTHYWGCSTGNAPILVLERTRVTSWDTVANGYPPFILYYPGRGVTNGTVSSATAGMRFRSVSGDDVIGNNCIPKLFRFSTTNATSNRRATNTPGLFEIDVEPILFGEGSKNHYLIGNASTLSDCWFGALGVLVGITKKNITIDGLDYVIFGDEMVIVPRR